MVRLAGSGDVSVGSGSGLVDGYPAVSISFQRMPRNKLKVGEPVPEYVKGVGPVHTIIFMDLRSLEGVIRTLERLKERLQQMKGTQQ